MRRILLVDDDIVALDTLGRLLRSSGYDVIEASSGRAGIRFATEFQPDVAVIDLRLPDMSGLDVLRQLRLEVPGTACVLLTGFADCATEFDAIAHGACACIHKPVMGDDVIRMAERALAVADRGGIETVPPAPRPDVQLEPAEPHALTRWAKVVIDFVASAQDAATLAQFGRAVGVSVGGFRNWCRTAGLPAREALWFARGLRASARQSRTPLGPENLLKIVDRRTLAKFLVGCGGTPTRLPLSVAEFLDRQRFITNPLALDAVRAALASRGRDDAATSEEGDSRSPQRQFASSGRDPLDLAADKLVRRS